MAIGAVATRAGGRIHRRAAPRRVAPVTQCCRGPHRSDPGDIARVHVEYRAFRIDGGAAPLPAAVESRLYDRALDAGRGKERIVPQRAPPIHRLGGNVAVRECLTSEGRGPRREGLGWPGVLAAQVRRWHRPLLDWKERLSR